jgi:hypothetical protein
MYKNGVGLKCSLENAVCFYTPFAQCHNIFMSKGSLDYSFPGANVISPERYGVQKTLIFLSRPTAFFQTIIPFQATGVKAVIKVYTQSRLSKTFWMI